MKTTAESIQRRVANQVAELELYDTELQAFEQAITALDHLEQVGRQHPISDAGILVEQLARERAALVQAAGRVRRMRGSVRANLTRGRAYLASRARV